MKPIEIVITGPAVPVEMLTNRLVDDRLIAAVHVWPIRSRYWWAGSIQTSSEVRAALHTVAELRDRVLERIRVEHPYEVACMFTVPLSAVDAAYGRWINDSVSC